MADKETIDADKQADLDFSAGFVAEAPPPDKPGDGAKVAPKQEQVAPSKVEPKPAPKPAAKVEPAKPQFVQITQEQFDALQAAAGKTTALESQISKAFGTLGEMQQVVRKLQSATPAGQRIELPKNSFAKMRESFPEVADLLEADMAEALKGLVGTGPANAQASAPDPEAVQSLVQAMSIKLETEALEDSHPNWREIVGPVDSEGKHDPNNEYRKWLAKQDAAYQAKVNATNSAAIISKSIDKFLASKTVTKVPPKVAPKIAARRQAIKAAIQPRGDGGQPPPSKTADDEFREGFRTG